MFDHRILSTPQYQMASVENVGDSSLVELTAVEMHCDNNQTLISSYQNTI
jgi:hypothetical protein